MKQYPRESWLDPRLEVRPSPIGGNGLFTTRPVDEGEVVIIFGGTGVFTGEDVEAGRAKKSSLLGIGENLWLGDSPEDTQGPDYSLNHSCDPNLWLKDEVTLVARRNIMAGEEVTMDYATHEADPDWKIRASCHCGSSSCRGVVTGRDWMKEDLQERYWGHFSPFLNRRISRLRSQQHSSLTAKP